MNCNPHSKDVLRAAFCWLITGYCAMLVGCGSSGWQYAEVSGQVKLDGQPLANAVVEFAILTPPPEGTEGDRLPVASGQTNEQGEFHLETLTPENDKINGAVVGNHRVTITSKIVERNEFEGDKILRKELLPPKYNQNSELTFNVPTGGTADCDFELSTK
ncbi:carboxypeptidase-like regulatory domain-containing protein [Aeoliella mucimassa]|uniref:Carboxypeptidase regulatory-like domain-containing protein n=1 Tax=Aeoliella mucimassa TaxID=2527972 RepID=A0A518ANB9_9BACT|nr:carboxypeptidase-like regulatory domain-containing protein [Aeoliella mucimassa]QDU56225.1 hypothetical protein Pan181_24330 [Aeoliella mucimassa]